MFQQVLGAKERRLTVRPFPVRVRLPQRLVGRHQGRGHPQGCGPRAHEAGGGGCLLIQLLHACGDLVQPV
ncbi:hypothetical protein AV521_40960 [Streptomyces sp. IMTB 2501]|nr:hypothetical protein AV521_40960 [Streptomyces sp. IMTB 2501]